MNVSSGLRFLRSCANLPLGCSDARSVASILYDTDGPEDVEARSTFYATSMLQPMAEAALSAPEFGDQIRDLLEEIRARVVEWDRATPVSMKLRRLLDDRGWNASDVLLVLPNSLTSDVFTASDGGVDCNCRITDATRFAEYANTDAWRRIMVVQPDPNLVRAVLVMRAAPEKILLLGDAGGTALISGELGPLVKLPEFALVATRAKDLANAIRIGGGREELDLLETEFRYTLPAADEAVDLTQSGEGYSGEVVTLQFQRGGRAVYRPGGDVLVFSPDEIRPFRRVPARDIQPGDNVLVLRKEIRDTLTAALSRSRKTATQLRQYHEHIATYRESLGSMPLTAKARQVLGAMHKIDPNLGDHEVPNIARWLSVDPSHDMRQPRAARDRYRYSIFMQVAGVDKALADALWEFAILPSRSYSIREGFQFNQRIVQFVLDPEGVASRAGWHEYAALWQSISESVDVVTNVRRSSQTGA